MQELADAIEAGMSRTGHIVPSPSPGDRPVNEPITTEIPGNGRATFTWEPEQSRSEGFVIHTLAASKRSDTTYRIVFDDDRKFSGDIPPTDIDDLAPTFLPGYEFEDELKVVITNYSSGSRLYTVQPVGFERVRDSRGGGR